MSHQHSISLVKGLAQEMEPMQANGIWGIFYRLQKRKFCWAYRKATRWETLILNIVECESHVFTIKKSKETSLEKRVQKQNYQGNSTRDTELSHSHSHLNFWTYIYTSTYISTRFCLFESSCQLLACNSI